MNPSFDQHWKLLPPKEGSRATVAKLAVSSGCWVMTPAWQVG